MSGHNKWSKIKNKKAVTDAKKSKIFSKIVRLIQVESRKTKGDINSPGLRGAILKAKEVNMPADNIERPVKKGAGETGDQMEAIHYETYGPGGTAVIIETLTDNKNRVVAEIKHTLSKNGLFLASVGSAVWAFEKNDGVWKPKTLVDVSGEDLKKLESLIEELEDNDDVQEVYTNVNIVS